jgi:hypothetical protein
VSQADAGMSAFDQAGQVGQDKCPFSADAHFAQIRVLGGERVIRNFRMRLGQPAEQCGFAGVGQADQPGIGNDFQFEDQPAFFAGRAGLGFAWRLIDGGGKGLVSPAATASVSDRDLLARLGQIAQDMAPVAVEDEGSGRDGYKEITATLAVTIGAAAGPARLGPPMLAMHDLGQAVGAGHGLDGDVAAVAAVAAVRPAARHVLLAPEAATPTAAVAALHIDNHAIDKHPSIIQQHSRNNVEVLYCCWYFELGFSTGAMLWDVLRLNLKFVPN